MYLYIYIIYVCVCVLIIANDCPRSLLYYYISSLSQQIPIIFINSYPLIPCSPHIPSFPHDPSVFFVRKTWNCLVGFMLPLSTLIAKVGRNMGI